MPPRPRPASCRPRKKLSGCALTAIIGGGLLLVLVPIVAILAAIALPAYNDYTVRAKVATAVNTLQPLKDQVQHFADDEGRCPVPTTPVSRPRVTSPRPACRR